MTTQTESGTYFYTLSTSNDPDRIAVPLVLANAALSMGQEALLWLTLDGVKVAKQGAMDEVVAPSFSAITELLAQFIEAGGKLGICPACATTHGITKDNIIDNVTWMGAAAVQAAALGRHTMSF